VIYTEGECVTPAYPPWLVRQGCWAPRRNWSLRFWSQSGACKDLL